MIAVRRVLVTGAALVAATGCLGRRGPATDGTAVDARLTLYRDGALIEERLTIAVDAAGHGAVPFAPRGLAADSLEVSGDAVPLRSWSHAHAGPGDAVVVHLGAPAPGRQLAVGPDGTRAIATAAGVIITDAAHVAAPAAALAIAVAPGPRAVVVRARYRTDALAWRASYTLIDDGDQRGRLIGALALDNGTGRQWSRATLALADAALGADAAPHSGPPRLLRLARPSAIGAGTQRVDLGLPARRLPLAPVLMFDPVGATLDKPGQRPIDEPGYGVGPWPSEVAVSVAPDLARLSDAPLPAGPLRMFRVDSAGELAWLGEGALTPPADDARRTPAISVGRSADVTGRRERTMIDVDYDRERLVEEFRLTFDNRGDRAVALVAREHLYRGECWQLVYFSTPDVVKAGAQQVNFGITVPARGRATIGYRVAYAWSKSQCSD